MIETVTDSPKEWEDFWYNIDESQEPEELEKVWLEIDNIEPLTPVNK
jgi:hypothetical protein